LPHAFFRQTGSAHPQRTLTMSSHQITELLVAWSEGDRTALEELTPLVHAELRRLAHRYMGGERAGHTLQTTALVNEAYLRLIDWKNVHWQNRAHFFGVSAQLMRRILVDYARDRQYLKRGGGALQVSLSEASAFSMERSSDLVALDEALTALSKVDRRKEQVVELRFFGGLSVEETAAVLQVSAETVMRDWRLAKVWLLRELDKNSDEA
jgi:RNA polymerase sigma-70 factor (ECF subfamily)